jgi:hypothetical protein
MGNCLLGEIFLGDCLILDKVFLSFDFRKFLAAAISQFL